MVELDPFAGLGKALAYLREKAGFSTQTEASGALKIDKGQLSRWEHESPRPTLENLGRLLAGYGATLADLTAALGAQATTEDRGPSDEELIRSLADAIRRVEGRLEGLQAETAERLDRLERDKGTG